MPSGVPTVDPGIVLSGLKKQRSLLLFLVFSVPWIYDLSFIAHMCIYILISQSICTVFPSLSINAYILPTFSTFDLLMSKEELKGKITMGYLFSFLSMPSFSL